MTNKYVTWLIDDLQKIDSFPMEYSRLPNWIGRKENNSFSSKEDN